MKTSVDEFVSFWFVPGIASIVVVFPVVSFSAVVSGGNKSPPIFYLSLSVIIRHCSEVNAFACTLSCRCVSQPWFHLLSLPESMKPSPCALIEPLSETNQCRHLCFFWWFHMIFWYSLVRIIYDLKGGISSYLSTSDFKIYWSIKCRLRWGSLAYNRGPVINRAEKEVFLKGCNPITLW